MKRLHIIIPTLLFTALLATGGIVWTTTRPNQATTNEQSSTVAKTPTERSRTLVTYTAKTDETSLAQLKREADKVITKQSEYGEYVDSIEGHKGGTDGKYWSFYVDGTMATVGAGNYTQKGGETIEWKFQKL